jgi:hypothetical protein
MPMISYTKLNFISGQSGFAEIQDKAILGSDLVNAHNLIIAIKDVVMVLIHFAKK